MTSYEFEVAAKNAVIKVLDKVCGIQVKITELEIVWFANCLGFKKCTLWGKPLGIPYAEVTYNKAANEMYVDIYVKAVTERIEFKNLDFIAHMAKPAEKV